MTFEIGLLLAMAVLAVVLFSTEWIPADVVALGFMVTIVVTGLLPARKAFAGFGSDTVLLIFGLLVLTAAMQVTGVMEILGRNILRHTGTNPTVLLLLIMVAATVLSAFMSNTAATAFFLPMVVGLAVRTRVHPGKLLMPLAFASILSSSVTLISTSTNLVISGLMTEYRMAPMGLFELSPVGLVIAAAGFVYMLTIGRRLIPKRELESDSDEIFGLRPYLSEVVVLPGSALDGKTLGQAGFGADMDLTVVAVLRGTDTYLPARDSTLLQAGDALLVEGLKEHVLKIKDMPGVEIKADVTLADPNATREALKLVEAILLPGSRLIGRSLQNVAFRQQYGVQVLGINRKGKALRQKLSRVSLGVGDVLLLQGDLNSIAALERGDMFRILGSVALERPVAPRKALATTLIFVGALALGTFNVVSLPVAALIGAVVVLATRCLTPDEAYHRMEWKSLILIASMLSFGQAMLETGTAKYVAGLLVAQVEGADPVWLLAGFFAITVALTQPMSNQAAAVVIFPVAVETATHLGLNPRSFAMMIAIAASCSYLTPLEPSCLMVFNAGRYRFIDFVKVGSLLTIIIFVIAIVMVPRLWPLK